MMTISSFLGKITWVELQSGQIWIHKEDIYQPKLNSSHWNPNKGLEFLPQSSGGLNDKHLCSNWNLTEHVNQNQNPAIDNPKHGQHALPSSLSLSHTHTETTHTYIFWALKGAVSYHKLMAAKKIKIIQWLKQVLWHWNVI